MQVYSHRGAGDAAKEDDLSDDRTDVASGANSARHDAVGAARDKRHDAEVRAAGLLAEDGEDDHEADGGVEAERAVCHADAEGAGQRLDDPQGPDAAAHAEAERGEVREHAAAGAGEEVHEAEHRAEAAWCMEGGWMVDE